MQELKSEISNSDNGIIVLKNRIIIKSSLSNNLTEIDYKTISEKYNITNISKIF